jgi:hypothetical protein
MTTTTATAATTTSANHRCLQFAILELGDRLRNCLRFDAVHLDALFDQPTQGHAIDTPAQNSVHLDVARSSGILLAQRHVLVLARIDVIEQ